MAKIVIPFGEKVVILTFADFDDEINIDELTSIDYSNLYGEVVTISALLNKIGLLKSEAESIYETKVLECDIYYTEVEMRLRREANISSGKFTLPNGSKTPEMVKLTDTSVKNAILLDIAYQNKKKAVINAKKNLGNISSLYWSVQSKDTKLSRLLKPLTPEEFQDEIVEGKINSIMIKVVKTEIKTSGM